MPWGGLWWTHGGRPDERLARPPGRPKRDRAKQKANRRRVRRSRSR